MLEDRDGGDDEFGKAEEDELIGGDDDDEEEDDDQPGHLTDAKTPLLMHGGVLSCSLGAAIDQPSPVRGQLPG